MQQKISVPSFIFRPELARRSTTETIQRQDDTLELDFPVFEKDEVMDVVQKLALRKRQAHDRPIDELIEIMDQVGHLWQNPNYELRKESLEVIPMTTGQSRQVCDMLLSGSFQFWTKSKIETYLNEELGGKKYLESWVPKGTYKLHAQPRGMVFHNLAGNAFSVGLLSLFYGLITKNVNIMKLPKEEPFFAVKLAESIAEVDKKIAKEIAVLYWSGSQSDIYDSMFNSGHVDCVLAWGGLNSIEDIRRRAYRYGIKIIDHGPKLSYSIISEDVLKSPALMKDIADKIAVDMAFWNQKACVSPRVVYIKELPRKYAFMNGLHTIDSKAKVPVDLNSAFLEYGDKLLKKLQMKDNSLDMAGRDITALMQRSVKLLQNEITDLSPIGFAKLLAQGLKSADITLPRTHLSQRDGIEMANKRDFFTMKYILKQNGILITPPNDKMDWTVAYLRTPPSLKEIDMCQDRFIIVTTISSIEELVHFMRTEKLQQYMQTISVYGSDDFVEHVAEEFSLLGAARFPRVGEHNQVIIGTPWDGHYVLHDMVRWVYIGFTELDPAKEQQAEKISMRAEFDRT